MGGPFEELITKLAGMMFFLSTIQQLVPERLRSCMEHLCDKLSLFFYPYIHITFNQYNSGMRNEGYYFIETYLGTKSSKKAKWLKADKSANRKSLVISLDEGEEIIDEFNGIKLRWLGWKETIQHNSASSSSSAGINSYEKKSFVLTFHKKKRGIITEAYLNHVMEEGKAIQFKNSTRKLYANNKSSDWGYGGMWDWIDFEHPATFDTLAMDPKKKQEIMNDLTTFKKGKDFYAKIGKAWKRGYLLYGPPGTGKSTMIAAIANFMDYDIYDLELTSIKSNSELKQLLIDTTNKSIIVIEDIDCSLDLTGKRTKKQNDDQGLIEKDDQAMNNSKVTLSGLLNFIDGIWSACGQERIIIFTTNHVEQLDPALIRRGRMDMHIEMSYCKFEAFKILVKNYLGIDSHPLFEDIKVLLEETNMSPCDVAENLMPKTDSQDTEDCLMDLISAMEDAREKARREETKAKKLMAKLVKKLAYFRKSMKHMKSY